MLHRFSPPQAPPLSHSLSLPIPPLAVWGFAGLPSVVPEETETTVDAAGGAGRGTAGAAGGVAGLGLLAAAVLPRSSCRKQKQYKYDLNMFLAL